MRENQLDINQMKDLLAESRRAMHAAIKAANIYYFEYFPEVDEAIEYNGREQFELEEKLYDYPESWFKKKITHPEDEAILRDTFAYIKQGGEKASCKIRNKMNGQYRWHHYNFTSIYDKKGNRTRVVCTAQDITEIKESEKRLEDELRFQDGIDNDNLLLKARCNITTDRVEEIESRGVLASNSKIQSFSQGLHLAIERGYDKKSKNLVEKMFSYENIQEAMKENKDISFDYLRNVEEGHPCWLNVRGKVLQNPETQDIIFFVYVYNINKEKKLTSIINRIVDIDFEVLALIYADSNKMERVRFSDSREAVSLDYDKTYDQAIREFIDKFIVEEEKKEAFEAFSLKTIKQQIDAHGVYELSFGLKGKYYERRKWEFAYFDETQKTIIYTRADITQLFKEQEAQKETLKNALVQAEEANNAKTNFLSRMSHEIRTPMNAIIGMNTLAMQSAENPNQVRDYLSKLGISARFLLSLINDILDMSRIESGKVLVKKEKFPMEELIYEINSIFYGQAEAKGIDYDCIVANFISDYYIGDVMKLQQILVNLLGNSIKFTNAGGKVQLIIRQDRISNGKAYLTFAVNDTGVGISEKDIGKIFDPFEQADATMTTPYKGTGLGLAIAQNLVSLMGGTIHVNSIEGIGTEFLVSIPLGLCEEEKRYEKLKLSVPIHKLRTLIVDDDILICEHTKELVEELGIQAKWVTSGFKAVEEVKCLWENKVYYDVILLDWKMPSMDGIETTKRIRKIVGDDVTIIVMTAYDWTEIEEIAKQAGVNLLITKPLFKSSIMSAFETVFQRKEEKKSEKTKKEYDFSGKNILLVEDHVLNVEVAKKLIQAKHGNVIVAENGLRAIEIFTENIDGFFDLILMDIRMPVMDGITATKAIRQLRKESALKVPIIAMSANAFDEDIDRSKEAGMNEHLSKPIEPQILYATLHKWLYKE